jgi:hypothetical protein
MTRLSGTLHRPGKQSICPLVEAWIASSLSLLRSFASAALIPGCTATLASSLSRLRLIHSDP